MSTWRPSGGLPMRGSLAEGRRPSSIASKVMSRAQASVQTSYAGAGAGAGNQTQTNDRAAAAVHLTVSSIGSAMSLEGLCTLQHCSPFRQPDQPSRPSRRHDPVHRRGPVSIIEDHRKDRQPASTPPCPCSTLPARLVRRGTGHQSTPTDMKTDVWRITGTSLLRHRLGLQLISRQQSYRLGAAYYTHTRSVRSTPRLASTVRTLPRKSYTTSRRRPCDSAKLPKRLTKSPRDLHV